MLALSRYLQRQRNRLRFFELVESLFKFTFIFGAVQLACLSLFWAAAFFIAIPVWAAAASTALSMAVVAGLVPRALRKLKNLSIESAAIQVEQQSPFFFRDAQWRSEVVTAAHFLNASASGDFERAHIERVTNALSQFSIEIRPSRMMLVKAFAAVVTLLTLTQAPRIQDVPVPNDLQAWTPGIYEILFPYPEAQWVKETGAIQGVRGSKIRFEAPSWSPFQIYLFRRTNEGRWSYSACSTLCELKLEDSGQYAVGTLATRSSLYPLQVYQDEAPKSALFAEVKGEWVPALALEILNQTSLPLELAASDDLRLKKVEIIHRYDKQEVVLETFVTREKHFKSKFELQMKDWKGGEHQIFLRPYDDFQSSESTPLKIIFNDENSLREKRIRDLNALINDWTHVLADLIETKLDRDLSEGLGQRLRSIEYPEVEEGSLLAGYVNELQRLAKRIDSWILSGADLKKVDDLISRVERQILYGLSLVFQEKAGDLKSTSEDLAASQADLSKLLEQIKEGKLDLNSKALEEAFKKLTEKLQELQQKISSLPQGPQDEMINREALEAQAQESEDLAKRIDDIRKQAKSGDEKGAMRELESLLNQLSILTKEMERGLEQWQGNLDQGALQKAQEFAKKLEAIKKEENELNEKTKVYKKKLEDLDRRNEKVFSQSDAKELKKLQEQLKQTEKQQKGIGEKFQEARKEFDTAVEGTEWKQLFRGGEAQQLENEISDRFIDSEEGLRDQRLHEADAAQKESIDLLTKAQNQQKQMMQQVQQLSEQQKASGALRHEKIDILSSEAKGEKERRRRIMESLKQQVGDKFQQSHERYFEELLQR